MPSILVAGEALMDCIPLPDDAFRPIVGGSPFNVAVAAANVSRDAADWGGSLEINPFRRLLPMMARAERGYMATDSAAYPPASAPMPPGVFSGEMGGIGGMGGGGGGMGVSGIIERA